MKIFNQGLSKRKRFVLSSVFLTLFIIFTTQNILTGIRIPLWASYIAIGIITYGLTYWSLKEDIKGNELVSLFVIPVLYTLGSIAFIFILPERKLYRYPIIAIYPVAMYAILLTNNIFNVAAIRTIQLLRAARAVSYLMTLVTTYFIVTAISATQESILSKIILYLIAIGLICYQFFWSFDLGRGEGRKVQLYTLTTTLLLGQICLLLQLVPIIPALEGLTIITSLYCMLGLSTHFLERKLTFRIGAEYIIIATIIVSMVVYTLPWKG